MDHQKSNFLLISKSLSVGGSWGLLLLLFWKLINETQMGKPLEPTRHHNSWKLLILLPSEPFTSVVFEFCPERGFMISFVTVYVFITCKSKQHSSHIKLLRIIWSSCIITYNLDWKGRGWFSIVGLNCDTIYIPTWFKQLDKTETLSIWRLYYHCSISQLILLLIIIIFWNESTVYKIPKWAIVTTGFYIWRSNNRD